MVDIKMNKSELLKEIRAMGVIMILSSILIYFFNFDSWVLMFLFVFGATSAFHRGLKQDDKIRKKLILTLILLLGIATPFLIF